MSSEKKKRYVDLTVNGRLFPSWIVDNFKKFKLPEIIRKDGEDPCSITHKLELRKYQSFVSKYLDFNSPHRDILLYHGLGSGKTATAINIYNALYNYSPDWNVFVLIKASLKNDPWLKDLKIWLGKGTDDYEFRFENIIFIHYDSPFADRDFLKAVKSVDSSKKSLYIIDECHNFINNVYSNINSKKGKRAQIIYDYIIDAKKEEEHVRVVCVSATPAINNPYELALLFNLLRPGSFPKSELEFNNMYISDGKHQSISKQHQNMFQRRIMGLVSYYYGATPDLYAEKKLINIDLEMGKYQEDVYKVFEDYETALEKSSGTSKLYRSYTRQACNFVFPMISQKISGENRPRPGKFRLSEREAEKLHEGKHQLKIDKNTNKFMNVHKYLAEVDLYIESFKTYLIQKNNLDKEKNHLIADDLAIYKEKYNLQFNKFHANVKEKSNLYEAMYMSSPKMLAMIFNIMCSPGPTLVYSNYVKMEGLEIFKIYLSMFGFDKYSNLNKNKLTYGEFHGGIDKVAREVTRKIFNTIENKHGNIMKIFMISPSGTEGINLENVRQIHIMEPYWNEIRIAQIIGRGIRQCSHKNLPMKDRKVDVFRYSMTRKNRTNNKDTKIITTDQHIVQLAKLKLNLITSFLDTMKEVAVDCNLFKNHNMINGDYKCFQFDEPSQFGNKIGPAYKTDMLDDIKIDNGTNSTNSLIKRIKVLKINAVIKLLDGKYTQIKSYLYYADSGVVYDIDLHYPIGKVFINKDGLPDKLDKNTYIISDIIDIPQV
jgi:superfamily II DNA or RNA helicase